MTNSALENCLNIAASGEILLIEDAAYAAAAGHGFEAKLREAMGRLKVYVLQSDLEARGMGDRLIAGVTAVDYGGFVNLTISNNTCQSWL